MRLLLLLALCLSVTACSVSIKTRVDEGTPEALEYEYEEPQEEVLPLEDK